MKFPSTAFAENQNFNGVWESPRIQHSPTTSRWPKPFQRKRSLIWTSQKTQPMGIIVGLVTLRGVFFFSGPVLSGWMVWYIIMFKVVDAFWIFLIGDNLFLQSFFGLKISQNILTKIWSRTSSNTATSSPETRHVQDARWLNPWGTFRNHLLDFPIFSFCQKTHLRPVQMWWMPRVERGVPLCPWPMQVGVSFGGVFDHQPVFGRLRGARLGKSILAGLSWTQVVWFEAGFHQSFSSQGHKI